MLETNDFYLTCGWLASPCLYSQPHAIGLEIWDLFLNWEASIQYLVYMAYNENNTKQYNTSNKK